MEQCLNRVEPAVVSLDVVMVAARLAVLAQHPHGGKDRGIAPHHRARFTAGAEILGRVEAERRQATDGATAASLVLGAMRLRRVFHYP